MLFRERSLNILSFIFKSKQYNLGGRICNYSEFYKHFFIYLGSQCCDEVKMRQGNLVSAILW